MPAKTPTHIENTVVELYRTFVRPNKIQSMLHLSPQTLYRILRDRGVAPLWEAKDRRTITEFRCTVCLVLQPIANFHKAGKTNRFATHKSRCKECQNRARAGWRASHAEQDRKQAREYHRDKRRTNINYRLRHNLSARIRASLVRFKGLTKAASTVALTGCSVTHLKQHLESLFSPGMSWETYGKRGWHIDHKKPCAAFDLTDPEQQKICFHWSNLQPLWAADNQRKSDSIPQ